MKNIVCILFLALNSCFVEVKECEYDCHEDGSTEQKDPEPAPSNSGVVQAKVKDLPFCGYDKVCYYTDYSAKDSPRPGDIKSNKITILERK